MTALIWKVEGRRGKAPLVIEKNMRGALQGALGSKRSLRGARQGAPELSVYVSASEHRRAK